MAKSHFSSKKRRKELDRKLKQEQKRQRRMNKNAIEPEEGSEEESGQPSDAEGAEQHTNADEPLQE